MLPISIAGSIRIVDAVDRVPGDDLAHVDVLEAEVAAGLHAAQMRLGLVGAGHVGARSPTAWSSSTGSCAPTGPM